MKRFLFCAGVLALAASCTESELDSTFLQNEQTKGITFQAVEAESNAATRGGFTPDGDALVPFWYAESDQINIWATGVTKDAAGTPSDFGNDFAKANTVKYKATESAIAGQFTAIQPDNILTFNAGLTEKKPAQFFALYPSTLAAEYSTKVFTVDLKDKAPTAQTQDDLMGGGIYDEVVKYSVSTAYPIKDYDAVGEKVNLNFQRVFSGVVFSVKNVNKYTVESEIFGKLETVALTAKGSKVDGSVSDASLLTASTTASTTTLTVDVTDIEKPKPELTLGAATNRASVVTLTLGTDGLKWSDDAKAYMVITPTDRTKEEFFTVDYTFENITLKDTVKTSNNTEAGAFHEFPALDINKYKYLVTNETNSGTSNDRTLIINSGTLKDIVIANGTKIEWDTADPALTTFGTIICNVELTDDEFKMLKSFTNLKNITLAKNTSIPAETFTQTGLMTIDMPLVTKIVEKSFAVQTALDSLKLPAYNFQDSKVNDRLLVSTIKLVDLSSVLDMTPIFGTDNKLSFKDNINLVTVRLNSTQAVKLSANVFNGCTNLTTVEGTVKLAVGAFDGCEKLVKVNVEGTVVPDNAFNDCKLLTDVLVGGKQIAPTEVGVNAFNKAEALLYMDLSNVTKLGKDAFNGAKVFVSAAKGNEVLTVGAEFIPEGAFATTAIGKVKFTNANSISTGIFTGNTVLTQVKFMKTFDVADANIPAVAGAWTKTFGETEAKVDFFYAEGQKYLSGSNLTLMYKDSTADDKITDATAIAFKGVYLNN